MNAGSPFRVDRRAVARAFGRAAPHYDAGALLQTTVRQELLARLQFFALAPRVILDLGSGTARAAQVLRTRYRAAQVLAMDLAPGMLRAARRPWWPWPRVMRVCADARAMPLAAHSVDLVFSNLMLQWCDDPGVVFAELRRVLRPGGLLLFSTFGPETLHELRTAWAQVDEAPHVSAFADMPLLGSALMSAGLCEPVMDRDVHVLHYPSVAALMRGLRTIGAGNAAQDRRRTLTGAHRLRRMSEHYERQRTADGIPGSWEVIYGSAFAPADGDRLGRRQGSGEVLLPATVPTRRLPQ